MEIARVTDKLILRLRENGLHNDKVVWRQLTTAIGFKTDELTDAHLNSDNAVGYLESLNENIPVWGYHLQFTKAATGPHVVLYVVTTGRLVRFEWLERATLINTIPIERISNIEERYTPTAESTNYVLSIELDAQNLQFNASGLSRTSGDVAQPDVDVAQQVTEGTIVRSGYSISVQNIADPVGIKDWQRLLDFSRALRLAVGG